MHTTRGHDSSGDDAQLKPDKIPFSAFLSELVRLDDLTDPSDTHGNLSMRVNDDLMLIKPSGMKLSSNEDDILKICLLNIYDLVEHGSSTMRPSVDAANHASIYRKFPDAKSICHTHSTYVVAHAMCGLDIKCASTEQADRFGSDIICRHSSLETPWADTLLRSREAVILRNHGAVCVSDVGPKDAIEMAVLLESLAKKDSIARSMGELSLMSTREISDWHRRFKEKYGQR